MLTLGKLVQGIHDLQREHHNMTQDILGILDDFGALPACKQGVKQLLDGFRKQIERLED